MEIKLSSWEVSEAIRDFLEKKGIVLEDKETELSIDIKKTKEVIKKGKKTPKTDTTTATIFGEGYTSEDEEIEFSLFFF